jgi:PPOX class probable F420-dependent enzyme
MTTTTRLDSTIREFLANPYVATATTLRGDGSPHTTVVWVEADDGGVSFNTARSRAKTRHIEADDRVSIAVVDPANPYRWVSVSGRAELVDDGADEQIDRLAKKYLGKDEYPWRTPDEQRVSVRIAPETVETYGLE